MIGNNEQRKHPCSHLHSKCCNRKILSHLGLFLCVLPHDRWLRVGTAMAYNGWTKHLGQTSSWHLIGITVGSNSVWREREKEGSASTVMYLSSWFTGLLSQ